jgi:hypothetical protein
MPTPFAGLKIGPRRTLDDERHSPAIEVELEEGGFQLQSCLTEHAADGASPAPTEKNGPPSNSQHLPRREEAGGEEGSGEAVSLSFWRLFQTITPSVHFYPAL